MNVDINLNFNCLVSYMLQIYSHLMGRKEYVRQHYPVKGVTNFAYVYWRPFEIKNQEVA